MSRWDEWGQEHLSKPFQVASSFEDAAQRPAPEAPQGPFSRIPERDLNNLYAISLWAKVPDTRKKV